jgi:hypothetical protein
VILVNGLFAFLQEYKSDRSLEILQQLITQRCEVIRDGTCRNATQASSFRATSSWSKKAMSYPPTRVCWKLSNLRWTTLP